MKLFTNNKFKKIIRSYSKIGNFVLYCKQYEKRGVENATSNKYKRNRNSY